jgi:hypothetical protein
MADGTIRSFAKGSLFVIGEIYGANDKDEGLAETPGATALKVKQKEYELGYQGRVKPGPADNSIFDVDRGDSIAALMGREGVYWTKSNKRPKSRINGLNLLRDMLYNAVNHPDRPGIYFFLSCTECLRTIPVLPRDEKKPEDVDTKANDHLYDALRYRVLDSGTTPKRINITGM